MCGIIYAKNLRGSDPVNSLVKMLYQNQRDRGQQGFGFVGMNSKSISAYRATDEAGIMGYLNENLYDEVLFHHRNPTSTQNTLNSTHPFIIKLAGKSYHFVHNGIIQNDDELQAGHISRGIAYKSEEDGSFNDSEALAWDFCLWLNGHQKRMLARGAVAMVCLETDERNHARRLYFYRNADAPLKIYRDRALLVISSEGNYPIVHENRLYYWDYSAGKVCKSRVLNIACPRLYDLCFDDGLEDMIRAELLDLKRERDYLISVGNHEEADYLDEQIMGLAYQLKGRI